jgi:hypothetical protein
MNNQPNTVDLRENGVVVVLDSNEPGGCFPLGYWAKQDGLYYADLKSAEQWHSRSPVNRDTIANKRLGGLRTKEELCDYITQYCREVRL